MDAWIKIVAMQYPLFYVASFVDVWIKMDASAILGLNPYVASLMDAWIKTDGLGKV